MTHRTESAAELDPHEWLCAVTHGLGLALAVFGAALLVVIASLRGSPWAIAGVAIYGATLIALYAASTGYHSVRRPRTRARLQLLDHVGIYLLIAGSYTPFLLTHMRNWVGWTLLASVWFLAAVGIGFKVLSPHRFTVVSSAAYVGLGWIVLPAIWPAAMSLPAGAMLWLLVGGVTYTAGVFFYVRDYRRFHHAIWHMFVLAGSGCHFAAVLYCTGLPAA